MKLSSFEKVILLALSSANVVNILTLRAKLGMSALQFFNALNRLREEGLIDFDGRRAKLTQLGNGALREFRNSPNSSTATGSAYLKSVSAPQISVQDFYLPNRDRFLRDLDGAS